MVFWKSKARRRVKNDSWLLRVQKQYGCKMFGGIVAADMPLVCSSLVFLTVKRRTRDIWKRSGGRTETSSLVVSQGTNIKKEAADNVRTPVKTIQPGATSSKGLMCMIRHFKTHRTGVNRPRVTGQIGV